MSTDPFIIKEDDIRDSNLNNYTNKSEQGIFFNFRQTDKVQRLGQFIDYKKLKILKYIFFLIIFIIISKVFYLQLLNGGNYRLLAEGNRIRLDKEKAQRGILYDRYGRELVKNKPTFTLYLSSINLLDSGLNFQEIIDKLNDILKLTEEELVNLQKSYESKTFLPIIIKENLNYEDAIKLEIITQDIPGFYVSDEAYRYYFEGPVIAHIMGYLGKISQDELVLYNDDNYSFNDRVGKTGLELVYENELRGIDGYKKIEVDSLGKEKKIISQKSSVSGKNFILAIDLELQKKLYQVLNQQLKSINKTKAAAVALNPNNGEILALVSLPSFDNNVFSLKTESDEYQEIINNKDKPLFNRVISGEYPSGSTIKPLVAAAALQENIIDKNFQIMSNGGIWYGSWFFPDWKIGGHGLTNIIKALAESVNTFFYVISLESYNSYKGLGIPLLTDYFSRFNLGKLSNIDLPNEKDGFIPTPEWKETVKNESWYPGDTFHLAIGQGDLLVTPLQIANLTAYFASTGKIYQPHLVKEIFINDQKEVINPELLVDDLINIEDINLVREGMRAVTSWGSARYLANLPIETGGKTGTAQVGNNQPPHAWFTVFAPFTNSEIVLTIIIENGGEGSTVAVPIAYEVLNWYFKNN